MCERCEWIRPIAKKHFPVAVFFSAARKIRHSQARLLEAGRSESMTSARCGDKDPQHLCFSVVRLPRTRDEGPDLVQRALRDDVTEGRVEEREAFDDWTVVKVHALRLGGPLYFVEVTVCTGSCKPLWRRLTWDMPPRMCIAITERCGGSVCVVC